MFLWHITPLFFAQGKKFLVLHYENWIEIIELQMKKLQKYNPINYSNQPYNMNRLFVLQIDILSHKTNFHYWEKSALLYYIEILFENTRNA